MVMTKDEFSEGVSDERQVKKKKKSKDKKKDKRSRRSFTFGGKEVQTYGREGDEKVTNDENYTFLMSLLPSIKKTGLHSMIGTQNIISEHLNLQNSNF